MNQTIDGKRLGELRQLLATLRSLNEELAVVLDAKISAMRRADASGMGECGEKERVLIERLRERDGLRCQLMDAIGLQLGLPPHAGRTLTITQLAARLAEAQRIVILHAADELRTVVFKVVQRNRVAGAVSREILNHLKWVFAAVRPRDEKPGVYSGEGVLVASGTAPMFELVG